MSEQPDGPMGEFSHSTQFLSAFGMTARRCGAGERCRGLDVAPASSEPPVKWTGACVGVAATGGGGQGCASEALTEK